MSACAAAMAVAALAGPAGAAPPGDAGGVSRPQGVDAAGQARQPAGSGPAAAAAVGPQITRGEILARAKTWADVGVPYSQQAFRDGYRTDCSGYISMAWHTNRNYWTGDLHTIGVRIGYNELKPGDMLLFHNPANPTNGSHVVLFDRWTGAVGGDFVIYEQTPPATKHRTWSAAGYNRSRYQPYRYVNVVDSDSAPATGRVFDNVRSAAGSWSGATVVDGNAAISAVAVAGLPNGESHRITLLRGSVYDNGTLIDGNGSISAIAAAGLPNGELHVLTLLRGQVFDIVRAPDGAWSGARLVDDSGAISAIAAAGLPNGELHRITLLRGSVYDNGVLVDGSGAISAIAAAGLPNGELHRITLLRGSVYDNGALVDGSGAIRAIAAAGLPNGELHRITLLRGSVYDNGALVDQSGSIVGIAAAGMSNGDLRLQTLRP